MTSLLLGRSPGFQASDSGAACSCSASNKIPKLSVIKTYTEVVSTWEHFLYNIKKRYYSEGWGAMGSLPECGNSPELEVAMLLLWYLSLCRWVGTMPACKFAAACLQMCCLSPFCPWKNGASRTNRALWQVPCFPTCSCYDLLGQWPGCFL